MTLVSLIAVAVFLAVSLFVHYVSKKESTRLPAGVRQLPGPKGV